MEHVVQRFQDARYLSADPVAEPIGEAYCRKHPAMGPSFDETGPPEHGFDLRRREELTMRVLLIERAAKQQLPCSL
jgi:hypothetical protein